MAELARWLNLLAVVLILVTGVYVHLTFDSLLSLLAKSALWCSVAAYSAVQLEFGFRLISRVLLSIVRV